MALFLLTFGTILY